MLEPRIVLHLARKEFRDAARNRWLLLYAVAFGGLSLALAWMTLAGAGRYGVAGFGRTAATLINLVLLIVPLMGLTLGAQSVAGEREQGTLAYLASQPVSRAELLLGKFAGLALALLAALGAGFGTTAVVIAGYGSRTGAPAFLALVGLACLLALVSLSLGFLISTLVRQTSTATGIALFFWLFLVFFGDLGLLGTALVLRLAPGELLALTLINPLQQFKIAAVLGLRGTLEPLGPSGLYAVRTLGRALAPALVGLLGLWAVVPLTLALTRFRRQGVI